MSAQQMPFRAEVSRLLDIVVHSLYSEKEIFLRELISNASDACDKLRYEALTRPELMADGSDFKIEIKANQGARTLSITDNGIGMSRDEMIENLGTIARSGTSAFIEKVADGKKDDFNLIGQFGVGFYAAFMVAETVEVKSKKAGEKESWVWASNGRGEFTVEPGDKATNGTEIVIHLKHGEDEFLKGERLRHIISKYSDHIAIPVLLDGDEKPVNRASALWLRPKNEITAEQYKEFYHHIGHVYDDPALTIHWQAEGKIEYRGLVFVPTAKPYDLYDPKRQHGVKLYVKRVFITDHAEGLVPPWLRFLRGVVDSEDLPLNISREMLQNNPVVAKIKQGITRRVLGDLAKFAADNPIVYATFWENFGSVLKEGLYEDADSRPDLFKLLRFRTSHSEGLASLEEYVGRMKEGQTDIFYINGDSAEKLLRNPHIEGFRAKGVEVLLLTDAVDDFWPGATGDFQGKNFKSVTRAGDDLGKIKAADLPEGQKAEEKPAVAEGELASLIALIKLTLGDVVKDVRGSDRLTDSPVCLVADENDLDIHLERFLKQHKQVQRPSARIMEINPRHTLITKMAARANDNGAIDQLKDVAWLLFDQARMLDGEAPSDPAEFGKRLGMVLEKAI